MKKIIGTFLVLFILFITSYFLLKMYGIDILEAEDFNKILNTIGVLVITSIVLVYVIIFPFFTNGKNGDYEETDTVAQRKLK